MDVHDYAERKETYASASERMDRGIGELVELLTELGLREGSLLIFTSDHGERLGEQHLVPGLPLHFGNPSFETLLRVPLITSPGIVDDPDVPIRSDDLHRMILALAGVESQPAPDLEPGELFLSELSYQTYRRGHWKSFRERQTGRIQLVDLREDPGETRDVAASHSEIVAMHARRIDELTEQLAAPRAPALALSEEDRERLRALGYLSEE